MKNILLKNKSFFKYQQLKRSYCYWSYEEFKRPPDRVTWGNLLYHPTKKPVYHSLPQFYDYPGTCMAVSILPHGENLYSYLVIDKKTNLGVVIDAGEPDIIINEAKKRKIKVAAVLCTENLPDFTKGINKIRDTIAAESFTTMVRRTSGVVMASDPTHLKIGGLNIRMIPCLLGIPAGTSMFYIDVENPNDPYHTPPKRKAAFFSGKFLTSNGILHFSRKSSEHVGKVIQNEIFTLDFSCQVFPAIEEALPNVCFVGKDQADRPEIKKKVVEVFAKRKRFLPCVPFDLEDEIETNPFLGVMRANVYNFLGTRVEPYPVSYLLSKLSSDREQFMIDFDASYYEGHFAYQLPNEGQGVIEATPALDITQSDKLERENYKSVVESKIQSLDFEQENPQLSDDDDLLDEDDFSNNNNNNNYNNNNNRYRGNDREGSVDEDQDELAGSGSDDLTEISSVSDSAAERSDASSSDNEVEIDTELLEQDPKDMDEDELNQLKFQYLVMEKKKRLYNDKLKSYGIDSVARDWLLESPSK